jgi:hypothetical protein
MFMVIFKRLSLVAFTGLMLCMAQAAMAQRKPATLADLKALQASQSWQELAQSLGDVPAAKRDAQWEAIATNTALKLLGRSAQSKLPGETFGSAESLLEQFPQLAKNKAFMDQRAEVGMVALKECYNTNSWWATGCNRELVRFTERDPSNESLQFAAGKLARLQNRHAYAAPWFAAALSLGATPARCADPDVAMAVTSALFLPDFDEYKSQIKSAQAISMQYCSVQMRPVLLKQAQESNSYFVANGCPALKKLAPAEALTQKACGG